MAAARRKIFLDASVIFAGLVNPAGGSGEIIRRGQKEKIRLITNSRAIEEVREALANKQPEKVQQLSLILKQLEIKEVAESRYLYNFCSQLIHPKDIHILYSALACQADFLITLDQKHFFTAKIKRAGLPIKILLPKDFLQKYFRPQHDSHYQKSQRYHH